MLAYGEVIGVRGNEITLKLEKSVIDKILTFRQGNKNVLAELRLNDGRTVTTEQRKKYYATINDIAEFTGDVPKRLHEFFKDKYCYENKIEEISMKDCSITEARELINMVMDFIIWNGIPINDLGINRTDDINRYLYMCLATRTCCLTGRKGEIHHCTGSRVGMGNNRNKISNKGRKLISLCREWHSKVHQEGEEEIFSKFKIYGITLNDETLKKLKISKEDIK